MSGPIRAGCASLVSGAGAAASSSRHAAGGGGGGGGVSGPSAGVHGGGGGGAGRFPGLMLWRQMVTHLAPPVSTWREEVLSQSYECGLYSARRRRLLP